MSSSHQSSTLKPLGASDLITSTGLNSAKNANKPPVGQFHMSEVPTNGDFST